MPRYAAFAQATAALEGALAAACGDGRPTPEEAGAAYHNAMDAWTAVQHLRFGPSLLFLRYDRIEFWPDKRGVVRRHLSQLFRSEERRVGKECAVRLDMGGPRSSKKKKHTTY